MAVYEQTYKRYAGALTPEWSRFLIIPRHALRATFNSKLFILFFVICFVPLLVEAILIYLRYNVGALGAFSINVRELIPVDAFFFEVWVNVQHSFAFLLALLCCLLVYLFLWRTKWGYELRATGTNPSAAEYGGISVRKQIIIAMTISGALAGMVGINEVLGYRYRYYDGFSDNYGFTGIAVALLGRNHPIGVIISAFLFAILQRGGIPIDAFTENVTKDIVQVLQGIIILFVAAEALFRGPFGRFSLLKRSKV